MLVYKDGTRVGRSLRDEVDNIIEKAEGTQLSEDVCIGFVCSVGDLLGLHNVIWLEYEDEVMLAYKDIRMINFLNCKKFRMSNIIAFGKNNGIEFGRMLGISLGLKLGIGSAITT